jgi:hypothetical protein
MGGEENFYPGTLLELEATLRWTSPRGTVMLRLKGHEGGCCFEHEESCGYNLGRNSWRKVRRTFCIGPCLWKSLGGKRLKSWKGNRVSNCKSNLDLFTIVVQKS